MLSNTKFTNYPLFTEQLVTHYRKQNKLPKSIYKSTGIVGEVLNEYFSHCAKVKKDAINPELIQSNLQCTEFIISELNWNHQGCKVVFIETVELAGKLLKGAYSIPKPEDIDLFSDSFILSLPKPLDFLSDEVSSILVDLHEYKSRPGDIALEIRYLLGKEKLMCNSYYIWSRINDVLSSPHYSEFESKHPIGSENYLSLIEYQLFKLVGSLFVFSCLDAGNVTIGLPNASALFKSKLVAKGEFSNLIIKAPTGENNQGSGSNTGHYRTFHFRQLIDDRYYKGKYKELSKGSRVIPIKASYIGKDIEPYKASES